MALEKAMGSWSIRPNSFGKDQRAKFSFAGFGKDHHFRAPMSKKSANAATKNIDRILIGS